MGKIYTCCCFDPRLGSLAIVTLTMINLLVWGFNDESPIAIQLLPVLQKAITIASLFICTFGVFAILHDRLPYVRVFAYGYTAALLLLGALAMTRMAFIFLDPPLVQTCTRRLKRAAPTDISYPVYSMCMDDEIRNVSIDSVALITV